MIQARLPFFIGLLVVLFTSTQFGYSANLVTNGDLETWTNATTPTSWDKAENITQESTTIHGDTYSAKQQAGTKDLQQNVSGLSAGTEYTISYWYLDNDANAKSRLWAYWLNGTSTVSDNSTELRPSTYSSDNASWQEYTVTITAPATVNGLRFEVRSYNDNAGSGFIYFDDFSVNASADGDPPTFTSTYPKGQSTTASGFDVAVSLDEIGSAYFVVIADGATAPSSAQVKAGTDASDGAIASTSKGTLSILAASTEYTGSTSSLSASTDYDVYVVAQDDEGSPNIQASPTKIDVSTTVAASAPTASTSAASTIDYESATLNGSVTANNASTTVTFEYGLTTGYGSTATASESPVTGSSGTSVSASISSLSASTVYHFRVKAVNSEGTVYGSDATLTTSAAPVSPTSGIVYISEVSDASSYTAEFMELYNKGSSSIDLSSSKIIRYPGAGGSAEDIFDFNADGTGSTIIPVGGFLIIARGASEATFESVWGALPEGVNYNEGHTNMYFGIGRQWAIKNGGTADTDDGTLIDETGEAVASSGNRSYQEPVGTWTSESYSGNSTPGALDTDQSLPVELSVWKAISSRGLVKLFWTTDSEIENQGFIIERSGGHQDKTWNEIASFTKNQELLGQGSTTAQNDYYFIDKQVKVGKSYSYRLADVDYQGVMTRHDEIKVTVKDAGIDLKPSDVKLHKAFPNPFNPDVNLSFTLENEVAELSLEIYDITGALVQTLSSGYHKMGAHSFGWNGYDSNNNAV
ncbi:MAG: hypothetical protein HN633_16470, partial [Candidatus Marinimicrobia bacterium]|nr:hypothetical protein [Candidatus Neomarinimicrobiota bacterium]